MLITRAEICGEAPLDVRLAGGRIVAMGPCLAPGRGEPILDAAGGALLPGLHDHHLHLFALAAAEESVRGGPPEVHQVGELRRALSSATAPGEWIRGIGYHESVAGDLDRDRLDALARNRPVRIQHRSGAMWVLNSAGVEKLGLDRGTHRPGVERDERGRATGRLFRLDAWLADRLGSGEPPSLARVSRRLARFGVTGVTDATAGNSKVELDAFVASMARGELLQRLVMMGDPDLGSIDHPRVERGAAKVLLDERDLPPFDELRQRIEVAHRRARPVAVHCVTRTELVLATAAFAAAGTVPGDRIEHASITPPEVIPLLAELGVTVVTQPHFLRERGDRYRIEVEARDRPWLYRGRAFLDASVPLGGGTDAPFGDPDPWRAMRAAVDRRTESGVPMAPEEALTPDEALALFTTPGARPGGPARSVEVGAPADLCLLDRPWSEAKRELSNRFVVAAIRDGATVWRAG